MMALICLCMLIGVATRTIGTQLLEPNLILTQGKQLILQKREKNKKSSSLLKKVELIYPRHWTTRTHPRWTKRKLVISQEEVKRKRPPIIDSGSKKERSFLGEKFRNC